MDFSRPEMKCVSPVFAINHSFKFEESRFLNALEPTSLLVFKIIMRVESTENNTSFNRGL
jgi:hypothetical protein